VFPADRAAAEARPYGPSAFEEARRTGRLVAIVVSRRACPRCRAVEAAAFSDPSVAAVLDGRFVTVALDPDERPDVAAALSDALLLLPDPKPPADPGLTYLVVATPDLRSVDGTSLAPSGRALGPALLPFLVRLADECDAGCSGLEARGGLALHALREAQAPSVPLPSLSPSLLDRPLAGLREAFDARHGGFGIPPRRVPHGALRLLLEEHARTGNASLLGLVTVTLDALVASPLRDPRGGFFREAAREDWGLPVKEKTLADNALLLSALAGAHEATGRSAYADAGAEVAQWMRTGLVDPRGGLQHAVAVGGDGEIRDPRVFAYTNGLAISGLARSGKALARADDLAAAADVAQAVLSRLKTGRFLDRWAEGETAHGPSFLDDYAFLAQGFLDLHEATGTERWRDEARSLLDAAVQRYADASAGGFFESADDGELRPVRRHDAYDGPLPSANAVMASALRRFGRATGETLYIELARRTTLAFARDLGRAPRGLETLAAAVGELVGPTTAPEPGSGAVPARTTRGGVTVALVLEPEGVRPGGTAKVIVRMQVAAGAQVVAHRPLPDGKGGREAPDLVPLALAFPGAPFRVGPPIYPAGTAALAAGSAAPILVHDGELTVSASLAVPPTTPPGTKPLRVRVVFQVCRSGRCAVPERVLLETTLRVESPSAPVR
jgi:uncharacterized protein YyaL (SSP411 family)